MPPPIEQPTILGRLRFRDRGDRFGLHRADRRSHIYLLGKTGVGKSTSLHTLALQDILRGEGLTVVDPHGDLVESIAKAIPPSRQSDLVYLNGPDPSQPFGYNPLKKVGERARPLAAAGLIDVFRKMWDDRSWGPRLEYVLRNALLVLLAREDSTLLDLNRLLTKKSFRKEALEDVTDPVLRDFWTKEYEDYSPRLRADSIAPIQNKVGAYLANPLLRGILTEPETPISFRRIMDERRILLVNLCRGQLGDDTSALLGGLIVSTLASAAFYRAGQSPETRIDHWVYVDEFQSFTTKTVATMLSELRKFGVGMTLAHQYLHQLEPEIRHAVLGNTGTLVSFRLGPTDAAFIAKEFAPKFDALDLMNLPNHHIRLKLLIGGQPSKPFSAITLAPWEIPTRSVSGAFRDDRTQKVQHRNVSFH